MSGAPPRPENALVVARLGVAPNILWNSRRSPFAFRPFAFAFCVGFAGPSLKHLTRRVPKTIGNYVAAQHACDLVHTARGVEAADRRPRPSASDPFLDLKVRVGIRGHLGEMRDAEHLKRRSERPQAAPDDVGRAAADAGIHLIEDQSGGVGARRSRRRLAESVARGRR